MKEEFRDAHDKVQSAVQQIMALEIDNAQLLHTILTRFEVTVEAPRPEEWVTPATTGKPQGNGLRHAHDSEFCTVSMELNAKVSQPENVALSADQVWFGGPLAT
mmetsp:Transcript_2626/g.6984  ORF Transcript_2626/g.6984 Transcript_2626/m.6984 type:complete len:104 (-) Transcript_2626:312-623(-)